MAINIDKLKKDREELTNQIIDLRLQKGKLDKQLDDIYEGKSHGNGAAIVEEIFKINKKIEAKRDKIRDIDKKLITLRPFTHDKGWIS